MAVPKSIIMQFFLNFLNAAIELAILSEPSSENFLTLKFNIFFRLKFLISNTLSFFFL